MRCRGARTAELHTAEWLERMFPPLENHRAAFRDEMRRRVAEIEEQDPGAWQRAVDGLISDDVEPWPYQHLILPMPTDSREVDP